jgi:hypothetical protein
VWHPKQCHKEFKEIKSLRVALSKFCKIQSMRTLKIIGMDFILASIWMNWLLILAFEVIIHDPCNFSGTAEVFSTSSQQTNTHELIWKSRSTFVDIWAQHGGYFQRHICSSTSWVLAFKLLIDGIKQFPWYHLLKYILIKRHLRSQSPTPIYKMCISIFSSHFILNRQHSVATKKNEMSPILWHLETLIWVLLLHVHVSWT